MSELTDDERRKLETMRSAAMNERTEAIVESFLADYPAMVRRSEELNRRYHAAMADLNRRWDARYRAERAAGRTPPNVSMLQRREQEKLRDWYHQEWQRLGAGAMAFSEPPETTAYPPFPTDMTPPPPHGFYREQRRMRKEQRKAREMQRKLPRGAALTQARQNYERWKNKSEVAR